MIETKLSNGDYVADGLGGVARCKGADALLERVLFRLTARRGQFPPLPRLGSRLYQLAKEPPVQRLSAATQYVAEALEEEDVTVTNVSLSPAGEGRLHMLVELAYQDGALSVSLTV